MKSKLIEALKLKRSTVAVILTDEQPDEGLQFKDGRWGCVGLSLIAASKGRTAFFDRKSFGCPGGGTGLGFGNQYERQNFPIEYLLSTGDKEYAANMNRRSSMGEGERFFKSPEQARNFVESLPITEVPTEFVVFKPLDKVTDKERPELVIFFVNADQLSALVVMSGFSRGINNSVIAPFGASCQSILFGLEEAKREIPRGIIGFFDISQRKHVDRETLSFTMPYKMFLEIEANVEDSFLETEVWHALQERQ